MICTPQLCAPAWLPWSPKARALKDYWDKVMAISLCVVCTVQVQPSGACVLMATSQTSRGGECLLSPPCCKREGAPGAAGQPSNSKRCKCATRPNAIPRTHDIIPRTHGKKFRASICRIQGRLMSRQGLIGRGRMSAPALGPRAQQARSANSARVYRHEYTHTRMRRAMRYQPRKCAAVHNQGAPGAASPPACT